MTNKGAAQEHVFQALSGNPAAIDRLADDYEEVAKHLTQSQQRLHEASADLANLKGKNFDALQAHVGRLLDQYGHLLTHFSTLADELHGYAKQLTAAQNAAHHARTRYTQAVTALDAAFSGAPTPVPTELLHPATYPDAPVDTTGWPVAALAVAHTLDAARVDWHTAKKQKNHAGDTAHEKIDSTALLQAMGFHTKDAKGGKVDHLTGGVAGVAGAVGVVAAGSKAAKRQNARKDYQSSKAAITKQFATQRAGLEAQLAAAKKSGDAAAVKRIEARLALVDDREKFKLGLAKEHRDDRLDRIDGTTDAKQERQEAHADAKERKELSDREYALDSAAARDELAKAQASGDPAAIARAQQHAQLVDDRHAFQQHQADAHLSSSLEHIKLAQHPGQHPAQAAHQLLTQDRQLANQAYATRTELENRSYALQHSGLEARIEAANASGDTDLAHQLQAHDREVTGAHEQRLAQLGSGHAERIETLEKSFAKAHPQHGAQLGVARGAEFVEHIASVGKLSATESIDHGEVLKKLQPAVGITEAFTETKGA